MSAPLAEPGAPPAPVDEGSSSPPLIFSADQTLAECANSSSPICYNTNISGANVITNLWISAILGALCYLGFVFFRSKFRFYQARLDMPQVTRKPPPLRIRGFARVWSWLKPVFTVSDEELLLSAGMDALVAVRILSFGIMLLLPITVFALAILVPINYLDDWYQRQGQQAGVQDIYTTVFIRMTMSNISPGSPLLWVHFVFLYAAVFYTCWLITEHYKEYISLRQSYVLRSMELPRGSDALGDSTGAVAKEAQPLLAARSPMKRKHLLARRTGGGGWGSAGSGGGGPGGASFGSAGRLTRGGASSKHRRQETASGGSGAGGEYLPQPFLQRPSGSVTAVAAEASDANQPQQQGRVVHAKYSSPEESGSKGGGATAGGGLTKQRSGNNIRQGYSRLSGITEAADVQGTASGRSGASIVPPYLEQHSPPKSPFKIASLSHGTASSTAIGSELTLWNHSDAHVTSSPLAPTAGRPASAASDATSQPLKTSSGLTKGGPFASTSVAAASSEKKAAAREEEQQQGKQRAGNKEDWTQHDFSLDVMLQQREWEQQHHHQQQQQAHNGTSGPSTASAAFSTPPMNRSSNEDASRHGNTAPGGSTALVGETSDTSGIASGGAAQPTSQSAPALPPLGPNADLRSLPSQVRLQQQQQQQLGLDRSSLSRGPSNAAVLAALLNPGRPSTAAEAVALIRHHRVASGASASATSSRSQVVTPDGGTTPRHHQPPGVDDPAAQAYQHYYQQQQQQQPQQQQTLSFEAKLVTEGAIGGHGTGNDTNVVRRTVAASAMAPPDLSAVIRRVTEYADAQQQEAFRSPTIGGAQGNPDQSPPQTSGQSSLHASPLLPNAVNTVGGGGGYDALLTSTAMAPHLASPQGQEGVSHRWWGTLSGIGTRILERRRSSTGHLHNNNNNTPLSNLPYTQEQPAQHHGPVLSTSITFKGAVKWSSLQGGGMVAANASLYTVLVTDQPIERLRLKRPVGHFNIWNRQESTVPESIHGRQGFVHGGSGTSTPSLARDSPGGGALFAHTNSNGINDNNNNININNTSHASLFNWRAEVVEPLRDDRDTSTAEQGAVVRQRRARGGGADGVDETERSPRSASMHRMETGAAIFPVESNDVENDGNTPFTNDNGDSNNDNNTTGPRRRLAASSSAMYLDADAAERGIGFSSGWNATWHNIKQWWRHRGRYREWRRDVRWQMCRKRIRAATEMFTELFGDDFDAIVPVYDTREVDRLIHQWDARAAALERAQLRLKEQLAGRERDEHAAARGSEHHHRVDVDSRVTVELVSGRHPSVGGRRRQSGGTSTVDRTVTLADAVVGETENAAIGEGSHREEGAQQQGGMNPSSHASSPSSSGPPSVGWVEKYRSWRSRRREAAILKSKQRIASLVQQVTELQEQITTEREAVLSDLPSTCFFATFKSQKSAAIAAQANLNPVSQRLFNVEPAPSPDDVNWPALTRSWWQRQSRPVYVLPLILFIMLLPIGAFTGAFAQLSIAVCGPSATTAWAPDSWYCSDDMWAAFMRNLVTSLAPSIVLSIYHMCILPVLIYYAAQAEGQCFSLSKLDRRCAELFFYWDVFNVFLGAMLGGSVLSELSTYVDNPAQIWNTLSSAIPASSNFFVNYVAYRALVMAWFRLFYPHQAVVTSIFKWLHIMPWAKTARDRALEAPSRNCRYGRDVGIPVLMNFVMVLAYALVSPIILPFGLIYFVLLWAVWRYQMLYVYQRSYESGGQFWPLVAHKVVGCAFICVLFTACVLILKRAWTQAAIILVTLPLYLLRFDLYLTSRYDAVVAQVPLMAVHAAGRVESVDPNLWTPPPLRQGAAGWHPEWGKVWQWWGVPRYTV